MSLPETKAGASKALEYWTFDEIGRAANVAPYPNVADNWPVCVKAFAAWGIATPLVLIGLLGTMAKESGTLYPVRESWWVYDVDIAAAYRYYADTTKHAPYQGGPDFHGRGVIQATHLPTYRAFQDAMWGELGVYVDLVNNPDNMLKPDVSANFAAWFFIQKGLVPLCEARDWPEVRRRVLGGYDADGIAKLRHAESVLLPLAQARGFA